MESTKFWNRLASSYDKQALHTYKKTYADTISKSQKYLNKNDVVLDIGCGSGITTIELSKSVKKIYAVDTAGEMLDIAATKAQKADIKNIQFEVSNIFDTRWKTASFDAIMAFNILCYIKDMDFFLSRVFELLKPDGIFLSATDCWGEKSNIITWTQSLLCKAHIVPFMRNLKIHETENLFLNPGFHILESCNLYEKLPNLYIAAKK